MNRVNLLLTDQSSSEVKMARTGHSTPSGSTRTKAAKGLFSHFMFLASLLLIALLTSGKALATNYTITLTGTGLTFEDGTTSLTQDDGTKTFTLVATDGYTLPDVGNITVNKTGGAQVEYEASPTDPTKWTYSDGTITLGASVVLTNGITVTASGVAKDIATLKTFTYSLDGKGAVTVTGFTPDEHAESYTVPIQDFTKSIQLAGVVSDESGAKAPKPEAVTVTINPTSGEGSATANLLVTAKDGITTKTYTVNFTFNKAKITGVTAIAPVTLTERVSSKEDVIAKLPATVTVTTEDPAVTTLPIEWAFKTGSGAFNPEAKAENTFQWTATVPGTLDVNSQTLKDVDVKVTNAAASTDATLTALTYSVKDGVSNVAVTGFKAEDTGNKEYTVSLPNATPDGKVITVTATPNDDKAAIEKKELTATLTSGTAEISFTVTAEDESVRTIKITFNRTESDVVTLSELKYQIGDGNPIAVEGFDAEDADGETYAVVLPYETSATAVITILPVATDQNAVITPEEKKVTLNKGVGTITLTVMAENKSTNQKIVINFTTAKEKIVSITAPTLELTVEDAKANEAAVKAKVDAIKKVIATSESGADNIELDVTWALKGGPFTAVPGAKNTYIWTITDQNYDLTTVGTTGEMIVVNYVAAFTEGGAQTDLAIEDSKLVNQIGNGEDEIELKSATVNTNLDALSFEKAKVSGDVTINSSKKVEELTFNNTEVTGKIDLKGDVPSIVLNNATIGEIALADGKETILSLQADNSIATITNAGSLTLNDAADMTPLSLAVETKATLSNKDIAEVVNNGTFTDNTARIVTVTGDADLSITVLPKSQSTTGDKVTLTVAAEAKNAPTYQWQKYSGSWQNVSEATDASLTINKVQNGSTQYRCEVKSTNVLKSTTLYTPGVTVRFYTESEPSEPSNPSTPTYTVSLDKVTGATFSKGETTTVDKGDNFSFKITLDKDYDQSKPVVTVDGKAIKADADGSYTIKNIQKDTKIIVSGIVKNTATGIEDAVVDAARAWSVGSTLYIHVPETADVYVISGAGAVQQHLHGVSGDRNMQLRAGFYIVRIGNVSQKVIIR